ncbi:transglutaminase domain-containing protein [Terrimonas pollutisoli]|uniref:transglutaminase domain-containing protein n=1 Tax=Terrimonas pollutisoli TaxID=3034147 RepID=UPI0023EBD2B8|nr:transglutaminase domain-containing protein [Terrimonas sp. H1YJ31]
MKRSIFLGLILISYSAFSQSLQDKNGKEKKKQNTVITPEGLAQELTLNCTTDLEKVKAIFYWITANIDYRTRPSVPSRFRRRTAIPVIEDDGNDTAALKPLDERVAENVLDERVAVCDGYARLFKTLCSYSGIQAEVIHGYARTESTKRIQRFRPNHSWNAVLIDSVWKLLDVTWASGYISWHGNDFVRQLDEQYFLTAPEQFIREHYPDDLRWTLMDDPPLMPEFRHSPFKQKSFSKYQITAYLPERGVIEASLGDTLQLQLETSDALKDMSVSSDPFLDTTLYSTTTSALLIPLNGVGMKTNYSYVVNSPTIQWLYILYNDDIVLRYKLSIKKTTELAIANKVE